MKREDFQEPFCFYCCSVTKSCPTFFDPWPAALHGRRDIKKPINFWGLSGGPVVENSCSHCTGHRFDPWSHVGKLRSEQAMWDSQKVKEKNNPQNQITFCFRNNFISAILLIWQINPMSWGQRREKSSWTVRNNSLPPKQLGMKTELAGVFEVK